MDIVVAENGSPISDTPPNKRKRKKSMVWEHFSVETVNVDCVRACCNQCKKTFAYMTGSKLAGTSHLKRHIALGICPVSRQKQHEQGEQGESSPSTPLPATNISVTGTNRPRKRFRVSNAVAGMYLTGNHANHGFAKMVIQHDYPLHMAEQSGFVDLARTLSPEFRTTSVNALEEQIMGIYFREKQKLAELVSRTPGRISLTLNLWTSNQSRDYVLLTGHFTDYNWKLKRRVLSFIEVPFLNSDTAYSNAIAECLAGWNSEGKLFTLTVEKASENARRYMRNLLSINSPPILNGQLLVNSCYARILSSLVQESFSFMRKTIEKVRHSVKYVKASSKSEGRFIDVKAMLQIGSTKTLVLDDLTKWNTTYHMLVAASELKEVFSCLDTSDPGYKSTISAEEWVQVEILCKYLKIFCEAGNKLTSPVYPTTNMFFDDVLGIHLELMRGSHSTDVFIRDLTSPLLDMFCQYWDDCYMVLAVAAIMDPRFKLHLVQFSISKIYDKDTTEAWISAVNESLHELYLTYVVDTLPSPTFLEEADDIPVNSEIHQEGLVGKGERDNLEFNVFFHDIEQNTDRELDQYLGEPLLPRIQDFDVLGWWKANESKYPTLCRMASDVLSIPVSTIPSDAVFDIRENKISSDRSSLRTSTLEALVCAKDWLQFTPPAKRPKIAAKRLALTVKTEG